MSWKTTWWQTVAGIVLFGAAFGFVEAAVVVYLRAIYSPWHAHFYPAVAADDLFPLLTLDQLRAMGPEHVARLKIELGRELATLLMLAGGALMAGRNLREWMAIFVASFGVWDITFYLGLKGMLNWPASLFTWDLLFLLPVPWAGPVMAPVVVALSMIVVGLAVLWREYRGDAVDVGGMRWLVVILGGTLVFFSFTADFLNTTAGGYPKPFHWPLFFVGEITWLAAFWTVLRRPSPAAEVRASPPSPARTNAP